MHPQPSSAGQGRSLTRAARQSLFEEAVLLNQPMARALAQQYQRRGVDPEDLVQVAMLGLVMAVRGYCPGVERALPDTRCPRSGVRSDDTSATGVG